MAASETIARTGSVSPMTNESNNESLGVTFENLPSTSSSRRSTWSPKLDQVRTRPGQWAKISTKGTKTAANSTRTNLKLRYTTAEGGSFEFKVVNSDIYARFNVTQS